MNRLQRELVQGIASSLIRKFERKDMLKKIRRSINQIGQVTKQISTFLAVSERTACQLRYGQDPAHITDHRLEVIALQLKALEHEKTEEAALVSLLKLANDDVTAGRTFTLEETKALMAARHKEVVSK